MGDRIKTMKKIPSIIVCLATVLAFSGCKTDYEEFYFKGTVIYGEMCSSMMVGYLMEIEKPSGVGDTITYNGTFYKNAVMAYRAPRPLKKDETVIGVAYKYKDFAALNCLLVPLYTLPELSIISVDEDPSVLGE